MKKNIKSVLNQLGYKISKLNKNNLLNENPFLAIKSRVANNPMIFDIGANQGQTIEKIKSIFPESNLHSFEPSKRSFKILKEQFGQVKKIVLNNQAVGSEKGSLEFNEYSWSHISSFLRRAFTQSEIIDNYLVDIITVDAYCEENNIYNINLLKTDTEGYELNVLKGASKMLDENKIQFIFVEIFFYENYIGQSSFGDIYNYLSEKGFNMVRFYDVEYTNKGYASRTDALFVNENFKELKDV
ncbi:FkbM family methyltransferase [Flavobacterium sp.]|uniref:FkbM family methyltransferase n=1 Tax=Flavobacterium sp. TaxID=239 RepID=UPI002B4B472D|nr:FkbM family methyltransferase [Flavobacterium sp.]HLF51227.1 FkbM family methyltransferase [Flavobacterium sp.]